MANKQDLKIQNEYNEALKMSQSLTTAITQDLDEQIDKRTTLGKKVKDYLNDLKSTVSQLETSEDVQKLIVDNEKEIDRIAKSYFGSNKKVGEEKIKALQTINRSLAIEGQRLDLIEKVDEAAQGLSDSMSSAFDGLVGSFDNIPIIGGMLSKLGDSASSMFRNKIGGAAKTFTTSFATNLRSGQGAMQALGGAGTSVGKALVAAFSGPQAIIAIIVLALAVVVATIVAAIKRFSELDQAAKAFREETGLLVSQTRGMQENIRNANVDFGNLGVSAEDAAKAAAEFTNEFGGLEQPSKEVLGSIVTLNKNFGVGVDEAAKLNKVFQNIGGLTAEQSQYLIGQAVSMAKIAGVAPGQVIKDMAENSEYAYRYFQSSPEKLAQAAVQAAKLGTSIKEAGKVADGLLDFESSITKELEASAILGTNINLSQARYLAANNDILGAQQAVNDQVAKLGDITKLNKFQQDALTEATGMEFDSLVNQQRIRERFGKLDEEKLAAALALAEAGGDISKMTEADLKAQTDRLAKQQEMQSVTDALKNETASLGTGFMDMLAPLGSTIMNNLLDQMKNLGVIVRPIMKFFGALMSIIFGVVGAMNDVFQAVVGPIFAIGGAILEMIVSPIQKIVERLQPLFNKFKELKAKTMEAVEPIMEVFRSLGNLFAEMVDSGPLGYFIDFLIWGLGVVFDIIGFIAKGIGILLTPIVYFITFLSEGIMSLASLIDEYVIQPMISIGDKLNTISFGLIGEAAPEPSSKSGESINDGVVQNGQVISTSPEDFLIATKNPGSLADSIGGMPSLSMDGVIQELRLLKEAFLSNKDVYMDTVKVTSVVRKTTERATDNRYGTLQA